MTADPQRLSRAEVASIREEVANHVEDRDPVYDNDNVRDLADTALDWHDSMVKAVERELAALTALRTAEARITALRELHLRDDDKHGMDCKDNHGAMLLETPETCAACRIFARALLSEPQDVEGGKPALVACLCEPPHASYEEHIAARYESKIPKPIVPTTVPTEDER